MNAASIAGAVIAWLGLLSPQSPPQPTTAQIVAEFFPQVLVDLAEEASGTIERRQCYAVLDTRASGAPRTIVAAYTNTSSAAIRVLRADSAGTFQVAAEPPANLDIFGSVCEVVLSDLDRDGHMEIVVAFGMMNSHVSWTFKWDGQALVNLTPLVPNGDGTLRSELSNAAPVDVDNDGVQEMYVPGAQSSVVDEPVKAGSVYRLGTNGYVKSEPMVGVWEFRRDSGAPETQRLQVALPEGALGPYTLHVVNGEANGQMRVSSAQVFVNDVEVLSPADFNKQTAALDRPIALAAQNEVVVRLAGAPGSKILVLMRSRDWAR